MIPSFDDAVLDGVARALGDALIGSNITRIFQSCDIEDRSGESTKWKRLYYTFVALQRQDRCANRVGLFIQSALAPARWVQDPAGHSNAREAVNRSVLLAGLEVSAAGTLQSVRVAATLDEATLRANRLRTTLEQRGVHPEVLKSCRRLLLEHANYFHAVFEATKGVADRLRSMSGSTADGNVLVDETLECGKRPFPIVALNRYDSPSLINEQKGIAHLVRGLIHAFRNVTAHEPQISWQIPEEDALDMMAIASLIHRRLDKAVVTTQFQPTP